MTDETPDASAAPAPVAPSAPSVVIDRNATVKISKRPLYLALAAVAALVAFTVIWFAVKGSDDYQPGPMAKSFVASLADADVKVIPEDAELRCIDDNADGIDPEFFSRQGLDVLGEADASEDEQQYLVTVLDDCLQKPTRVGMLASSLDDESIDREQATCLAGKLDDAIVKDGGYRTMVATGSDTPEAASTLMTVLFSSLGECNIDLGQIGGDSSD